MKDSSKRCKEKKLTQNKIQKQNLKCLMNKNCRIVDDKNVKAEFKLLEGKSKNLNVLENKLSKSTQSK